LFITQKWGNLNEKEENIELNNRMLTLALGLLLVLQFVDPLPVGVLDNLL